jgi:hypothetical protein
MRRQRRREDLRKNPGTEPATLYRLSLNEELAAEIAGIGAYNLR